MLHLLTWKYLQTQMQFLFTIEHSRIFLTEADFLKNVFKSESQDCSLMTPSFTRMSRDRQGVICLKKLLLVEDVVTKLAVVFAPGKFFKSRYHSENRAPKDAQKSKQVYNQQDT